MQQDISTTKPDESEKKESSTQTSRVAPTVHYHYDESTTRWNDGRLIKSCYISCCTKPIISPEIVSQAKWHSHCTTSPGPHRLPSDHTVHIFKTPGLCTGVLCSDENIKKQQDEIEEARRLREIHEIQRMGCSVM